MMEEGVALPTKSRLVDVLVCGSPGCGKRTLFSRLVANARIIDESMCEGGSLERELLWALQDPQGDVVAKFVFIDDMTNSACVVAAPVVIFVIDMTDKSTFSVVKNYIEKGKVDSPAKFLVGAKSDRESEIDLEEAEAYAISNCLTFVVVSAFDGTNVDLLRDLVAIWICAATEESKELTVGELERVQQLPEEEDETVEDGGQMAEHTTAEEAVMCEMAQWLNEEVIGFELKSELGPNGPESRRLPVVQLSLSEDSFLMRPTGNKERAIPSSSLIHKNESATSTKPKRPLQHTASATTPSGAPKSHSNSNLSVEDAGRTMVSVRSQMFVVALKLPGEKQCQMIVHEGDELSLHATSVVQECNLSVAAIPTIIQAIEAHIQAAKSSTRPTTGGFDLENMHRSVPPRLQTDNSSGQEKAVICTLKIPVGSKKTLLPVHPADDPYTLARSVSCIFRLSRAKMDELALMIDSIQRQFARGTTPFRVGSEVNVAWSV